MIAALAHYEAKHPEALIDVRRKNPVAIHIRIIDPDFAGSDRVDREDEVWEVLESVPDDLAANITMVLLLTPDEAERSFASFEFDHPVPSRL
ncbi:MAG: hypothetical protein WD069_09565 [Planctomycetales bacterium]